MKICFSLLSILFIFNINSYSQDSFHKSINIHHPDSTISYLGWPYTIDFYKNEIISMESNIVKIGKEGSIKTAHDIRMFVKSTIPHEKGLKGFGYSFYFSKNRKAELIQIEIDSNDVVQDPVVFRGFLSDFQVGKDLKTLPNKHTLYACHHQYENENYKRGLFLKTDENNNAMWAMEISDSISTTFEKVEVDKNGNIYLFGSMLSKQRDTECFVIKLSAQGKIIWSKSFGGISIDDFYDAILASDGSLYLVGQTLNQKKFGIEADGFILKLDQNGNQLWVKAYGNKRHDGFWKIKEAKNGDIYVLGRISSTIGSCSNFECLDVYFLQLDTSGNRLHGIILGVDNKWDVGYCFDLGDNDKIIIGGQSIAKSDSISPFGAFFYSKNGIKGFCDSKVDTSSVISFSFDENKGPKFRAIPLFTDSVIKLYYRELLSEMLLREDFYCSTVSLPENEQSNKTFTVFPNPATKELNIAWNNALNQSVNLKLYTMQGQLVLEQEMSGNEKLDVSLLQNGTYILLIKSKGIVQREIILVE